MVGKPAKKLSEKVKLSQFRALVTVANTGSFSAAALHLNVSQSTISHSIAALEDALGVILIHRGRQRASLTPVGDRIFAQAQQALALVETMGQEAAQARGIEGGTVRIAAFRSLASEVLPGAIAHLHQHHPTVQVSIIEFESLQGIIHALQEGKADISMSTLLQGDEFETFLIMDDPFIALLPPNNPELPNPLTWDDLRKHPLITSSSDCCKGLTAKVQSAHPPVNVDYFISNDSTAVSMTRQGLGITMLPKLAAQPIPDQVRVAQLPFEMVRPLGISWLKSALLTPATYAFLDTFTQPPPHQNSGPGARSNSADHQQKIQRNHKASNADLAVQYGDEHAPPSDAHHDAPVCNEKASISATRHH